MVAGTVSGDIVMRSQGKSIRFSADSGATAHVNINTNGNVGIGTAAPVQKLEVNGTVSANGLIARNLSTSSYYAGSADAGSYSITAADLGFVSSATYYASAGLLTISWKSNVADVTCSWTGIITHQYPDSGSGAQDKRMYATQLSLKNTAGYFSAVPANNGTGTSIDFTTNQGSNGYYWTFINLSANN